MESSQPAGNTIDGHNGTVYVIDDEEPVLLALTALIRSFGLTPRPYPDPQAFLLTERLERPACLVLDVRLKGHSGLLVQRAMDERVRVPIIFLTSFGDVEMSVKAMKAGAINFLTKPFRDQDMLDAVTEALASDRMRLHSERACADLLRNYQTLTLREREVSTLIVEGRTNREIAAEMNISEITVKVHRCEAMRKMVARSFADFVLKVGRLHNEVL